MSKLAQKGALDILDVRRLAQGDLSSAKTWTENMPTTSQKTVCSFYAVSSLSVSLFRNFESSKYCYKEKSLIVHVVSSGDAIEPPVKKGYYEFQLGGMRLEVK